MDAITIVGGLTAAATSGLAIGAGTRLLPTAWQASRDLRSWSKSPDGAVERTRLLQLREQHRERKLNGRKRESSIIGLY
jgi:hypothetical protein